jgi:acetyl esterase/lipase
MAWAEGITFAERLCDRKVVELVELRWQSRCLGGRMKMMIMMRYFYGLAVAMACWGGLYGQEPEHVRDVIYAKHDGVALTMDVFVPEKANGAGIIKIVSGGWKSNHKGINDGGWPKAGYVTFVVVHGSQPRFQVDEIVADLNRAVRFVRANAAKYGVDPNKLGVTGSSAGGHLSLMLATRGGAGDANAVDPIDRESSTVQAVACFYPPTDYLNWFEDGDNAVGIGRLAAYAGAFGPQSTTAEGREALGRELSPVYWVHQNQPPVFIVHGDADPQVSITQAHRFFKRCQKVGVDCEVVVREGAGHGGWQEMAEDTARMTEWFDWVLLGKAPQKPFRLGISSLPSTPVKKPAAVGR